MGLYDVPVLSLPDAILALGPSAIHIFHQVQGTYPAGTVEAELQLHLFKDEWAGWDEDQKRTFHGRWCYTGTVATSSLLLTEQLRTPIRIEFSGLGGSHVLEEPFVADLFVKCMPSAPCYGPSLAYVDRKDTDQCGPRALGGQHKPMSITCCMRQPGLLGSSRGRGIRKYFLPWNQDF